jgi:hypothetical protein
MWSLTELAGYLAYASIASVSRETIRQILHAGGMRWRAIRTWKASAEPGRADVDRQRPVLAGHRDWHLSHSLDEHVFPSLCCWHGVS